MESTWYDGSLAIDMDKHTMTPKRHINKCPLCIGWLYQSHSSSFTLSAYSKGICWYNQYSWENSNWTSKFWGWQMFWKMFGKFSKALSLVFLLPYSSDICTLESRKMSFVQSKDFGPSNQLLSHRGKCSRFFIIPFYLGCNKIPKCTNRIIHHSVSHLQPECNLLNTNN